MASKMATLNMQTGPNAGSFTAVFHAADELVDFHFPQDKLVVHHLSAAAQFDSHIFLFRLLAPAGYCGKLSTTSRKIEGLYKELVEEKKTAVVLFDKEEIQGEIHLIPMKACGMFGFWCWFVPEGSYDSFLSMLYTLTIGVVLDPTKFVVSNTIKTLTEKSLTMDQDRLPKQSDSWHILEKYRAQYLKDRELLSLFVKNDREALQDAMRSAVVEISDDYVLLIRLSDNTVLVHRKYEDPSERRLINLWPHWDGLKKTLVDEKYRVYFCTKLEKKYMLDILKILDSNEELISSSKHSERINFVNSGSKKNLSGAFEFDICPQNMAFVIDDRDEWDEEDQDRVIHIAPFCPYMKGNTDSKLEPYVINIRRQFYNKFKTSELEFPELSYEVEMYNLPIVPDVQEFVQSILASNQL